MGSEIGLNNPSWYVLNYIGNVPYRNAVQKTVDQFNKAENLNLELFAPTHVVREEKDGKVCMKRIRLAYHYVFLRGMLDDIKRLCRMDNGFSFLINHGSAERYAVIGDKEMRQFKDIARAYENCLPYYSLRDIDLEDGDLVEIVNGDFPGLVGTFFPKAKSNSGNIVLRVAQNLGTMVYDIKASDVRVLRFASNSTRAYDQIDAFVPKLLKALRHYYAGESLPAALSSRLAVFCMRLDSVRLSNPKLEAKLLALLSVANHLLGNITCYERQRERYEKCKASVSNLWTESLIELLFAVTDNDLGRLAIGEALIADCKPLSAAQRELLKEYTYYSQLTAVKNC